MNAPEIFFVGDDALAVRLGERAARHALAAALRASGQWVDVVPGKGEVTVQFDPLAIPPRQAEALLRRQAAAIPETEDISAQAITLHMQADDTAGPDLARIAAENGVTPEAFLARISASPLIVDMMGFTAGFAYVSGLDPALIAPRLDTPRQRVPAGSVGMISGQLGLYALAGPAGWPIIGRIAEPLFEARREAPFALDAGVSIRLVIER